MHIQNFKCAHYKRSCLLIAECCKRTYPCRFCHDDNEDHKIDRYNTKEMICLICGTVQDAQRTCIKCKLEMADYFCDICKLWTENRENTFHCQYCNVCRHGKTKNYFHCMVCNACMDIRLKNNHSHIEDTLKSDCPICAEYLFISVKEVALMKCGHAMHVECYEYYIEKNYQCPICTRSTGDTSAYNTKVDIVLAGNSKLQKEAKKWRCDITCYDCNAVSNTKYRFLYNKCLSCNSYNTRLGEIFKTPRNG